MTDDILGSHANFVSECGEGDGLDGIGEHEEFIGEHVETLGFLYSCRSKAIEVEAGYAGIGGKRFSDGVCLYGSKGAFGNSLGIDPDVFIGKADRSRWADLEDERSVVVGMDIAGSLAEGGWAYRVIGIAAVVFDVEAGLLECLFGLADNLAGEKRVFFDKAFDLIGSKDADAGVFGIGRGEKDALLFIGHWSFPYSDFASWP